MTVLVMVFAFSSVLGNYSYAEINMSFLGANHLVMNVFRIAVIAAVGFGALAALAAVWALADVAMALMAMVNLVAIVWLGTWAVGAFADYRRQRTAARTRSLSRMGIPIFPASCPVTCSAEPGWVVDRRGTPAG